MQSVFAQPLRSQELTLRYLAVHQSFWPPLWSVTGMLLNYCMLVAETSNEIKHTKENLRVRRETTHSLERSPAISLVPVLTRHLKFDRKTTINIF